jgi:MscS family membrane protein
MFKPFFQDLFGWSYWGDLVSGFLFLSGIVLKWGNLHFIVALFRAPYKRYIKAILANLQFPLQWILIYTGFMVLLYHGTLFHPGSVQFLKWLQTLLTLLIGWAVWRETNHAKEIILLFDQKFNKSFHDIAVPLIRRGMKLGIVLVEVVVISCIWGYSVNRMVAGLGVSGIIISFTAQDLIKNTFSAFILLFNNAFDIGDWIESSQISGAVESISLRFTKIRTLSHGLVSVPNSQLANSNLTNWSRKDRYMVQLAFPLDPSFSGKSLTLCIDELINQLKTKAYIDPESILCYVEAPSTTSMNLSIRFDVKTTDFNEMTKLQNESISFILELLKSNSFFKS